MQRWFSARVTYAEYLQPSKRGSLVVGAIFGVSALIYMGIQSYRVTLLVIFCGQLRTKFLCTFFIF